MNYEDISSEFICIKPDWIVLTWDSREVKLRKVFHMALPAIPILLLGSYLILLRNVNIIMFIFRVINHTNEEERNLSSQIRKIWEIHGNIAKRLPFLLKHCFRASFKWQAVILRILRLVIN